MKIEEAYEHMKKIAEEWKYLYEMKTKQYEELAAVIKEANIKPKE